MKKADKQEAKAQKQAAKNKKQQEKQEAKARKQKAKSKAKQEKQAAKNKKKQEKQEAKNKNNQAKNEAKEKKQKDKQAAKAKKQESKKAAAAKKQQAKQAKAAKKAKTGEDGQQYTRRLNLKVVIPLAVLLVGAAAGAFFFLFGGDDGLTPPTAYAIAEESTIVLDGFLDEDGKLVAVNLQMADGSEIPETEDNKKKEDKKDKDKEDAENPENAEETDEPALLPIDAVALYDYTGVTPEALEQYLDALLAEDEGFVLVADDYNKLETRPVFAEAVEPDAESEEADKEDAEKEKGDKEKSDKDKSDKEDDGNEDAETLQMVDGTVLLARETTSPSAEGRLFQLRLTWTADGACTVEVSCPVASFPAEPLVNSGGALNYIKSRRPSDLGLPGESMDEYNIYNQDGVLVIDGRVYRKFIVYELNEKTGTNSYVGEYLLSGDGRSIYKRDSLTGVLERVQ